MAQTSTPTAPDRLLQHADEFARRDPAKAIATAFGFGFLVHLLPLGAIASLVVSLLFAVARPVLLLLGALKALELARPERSSDTSEGA